jgi:hypothetical protein
MLPIMLGEKKPREYLWALATPILLVAIAWLVGLLMFDIVGAGYLRAFFGRLLRLGR